MFTLRQSVIDGITKEITDRTGLSWSKEESAFIAASEQTYQHGAVVKTKVLFAVDFTPYCDVQLLALANKLIEETVSKIYLHFGI